MYVAAEPVAVAVAVIVQRYQPFPTFTIDAVVDEPTEPITPLSRSKFAHTFEPNLPDDATICKKLFVFFFA